MKRFYPNTEFSWIYFVGIKREVAF